jgi:hypothetical protein
MNVNVIMSHVYIARSMELWGTKGPLGPSAQIVGVIHTYLLVLLRHHTDSR